MEPIYIKPATKHIMNSFVQELIDENYELYSSEQGFSDSETEYIKVRPRRGLIHIVSDKIGMKYDYIIPTDYAIAKEKCVELKKEEDQKKSEKENYKDVPPQLRSKGFFQFKITDKQRQRMEDAINEVYDGEQSNGIICCQAIVDTKHDEVFIRGAWIPPMKAWPIGCIIKDTDLHKLDGESMDFKRKFD